MSKETTAWAIALSIDNDYIPDFTVEGKMENVLQIHSDKKSAERFCKSLEGSEWRVVKCKIIIDND